VPNDDYITDEWIDEWMEDRLSGGPDFPYEPDEEDYLLSRWNDEDEDDLEYDEEEED